MVSQYKKYLSNRNAGQIKPLIVHDRAAFLNGIAKIVADNNKIYKTKLQKTQQEIRDERTRIEKGAKTFEELKKHAEMLKANYDTTLQELNRSREKTTHS